MTGCDISPISCLVQAEDNFDVKELKIARN